VTTDLVALLREVLRRGRSGAGEIELYRALLSGEGLNLAAVCLLDAIRDHGCDLVGGTGPGDGALAAAVALAAHRAGEPLDALLVPAPAPGASQLLGPLVPGSRVALVTASAGDGEALLHAVAVVEAQGGVVRRVVSLVDPHQGAAAAFQAAGHRLHTVIAEPWR
jgi:orotate phosphoribosyltransferase